VRPFAFNDVGQELRLINPEKLAALVERLLLVPRETPWVEHKRNNADPQSIGENLSAVANSAALAEQPYGYLVWGIDDTSKKVIGTTFKPSAARVGNEILESWLLRLLSPRMPLSIYEFQHEGHDVSIIEIAAATHTPIRFRDFEYVRIDSYTKRLSDFPERERALWAKCSRSDFEATPAVMDVGADEVLSLLDWAAYLAHKGIKELPEPSVVLEYLEQESFVAARAINRFDITNLGALLYARDLTKFQLIGRKPLRVVQYRSKSRVESIGERVFDAGYALSFVPALRHISGLLPTVEKIVSGVRREVEVYPQIAIRELLANSLIHQDLSLRGAGPMTELFPDRLEVSNPGRPLMDVLRLMDHPPQSRNERLAAYMRRLGFCEERGAGIDRVFHAVEQYSLPPADFQNREQSFLATLYGPRALKELSKTERLQACYWHACLKYVEGDRLTNASLRQRLDIAGASAASLLIRDAVAHGLIKQYDRLAGARSRSYVPIWA
jgi:ATP-dependent DNA helicase RecG